MILGLGSDIIDIRRIEQTIARYGDRFLARVFTDTERLKSERRAARVASYAKRFAAKEACAKALGTGLRKGVYWRDMGVINLRSGRPTMVLTGGAATMRERSKISLSKSPSRTTFVPSPSRLLWRLRLAADVGEEVGDILRVETGFETFGHE